MEPQPPGPPNYASLTPAPPPPVISPAPPQQPARPTTALVLGILLLVFAGYGLFSLVGAMFMMAVMTQVPVDGATMPSTIFVMIIFSGLLNVGLYIPMGIGLLKLQPWARTGAIISVVVITLMALISRVISMKLISRVISMNMLSPGGVHAMPGMTGSLQMISSLFGIIAALGINGTMLYFLTRPEMVQAFAKKGTRRA